MKHTPGKWIFGNDPMKEVHGTFIMAEENGVPMLFIARLEELPDLDSRKTNERKAAKEQMKANAKLISAAPELLEALKELNESCINQGYVPPSQGKAQQLIDKITKATS